MERLFWREVVEVARTGGWVCGDKAHQRALVLAAGSADSLEHRPATNG